MSNEVAFNSLERDDVKITFEEGSGVLGKPTDEEVAQHKKTRLVLVVLFGIIVLTMVVVAVIIIIVSPKCEPKSDEEGSQANQTTDDPVEFHPVWWKNAVIYQIYPRSFFDKSGDGEGDLSGISEKLNHFSNLGVSALLLNPVYDPEDFKAVNKMFGPMEDFDNLLMESHKKGLKVILDFVPNHTSKRHPWFVESSRDKTSAKRDWYVWADGVKGRNGTYTPPNNWINVEGGSAWEYDNTTDQFYLHQFKKDQPDLNLRNEDVIAELKKVLEFWIDKGVDGFRINDVQYFLEDRTLANQTSTPMAKSNLTFDLEGNREILKEFQEVINNGSKHLLIAEVESTSSVQYYGSADILQNVDLITKVNRSGMTLSQGIKNSVVEYMNAVPDGETPNWLIGNLDVVRVGSRLGQDYRNAMNVLLMTLPGAVTAYYGEEIGMLNGANEKTPMQWSDESNAGFTNGKPWQPVPPTFLTLNVKTEKEENSSIYNNYIKLAALRNESSFAIGNVTVVHSDTKVFAFLRNHKDFYYLVVINFGDMWDGDIDGLSGRGTKVFDSEKDTSGTEQVDVNKIKLNPGQAVIVKRTSEKWVFS